MRTTNKDDLETDADKLRLVFWFAVHMFLKVHFLSIIFQKTTLNFRSNDMLNISMPFIQLSSQDDVSVKQIFGKM